MNPFGKKRSRLDAMRTVQDATDGKIVRMTAEPYLKAFCRCPECYHVATMRTMRAHSMVCPKCGQYLSLSAAERMRMTFDGGRYREIEGELVGIDPLGFPGYDEKIAAVQKKTGIREAAICAVGLVGGYQAVVVALDSRFFMGSMGTAVGERVTRAAEYATAHRLPLVIFSASGGARMQEGIMSLMQMAKTSAAIARHSAAKLLFVSVMTHPTTGGVTASFASLGDVMLAEPHALIGFAGPRVIEQTINQKLPEGFQRAESLLGDGFLDAIVERHAMTQTIIDVIAFACERDKEVDDVGPVAENRLASSALSPQERLAIARNQHRPHIGDYIGALFTDFEELHGDRCFGDDGSIVGGIARFRGIPVMVIGQRKGDDVESNIASNFGMPEPEGYRKVQRLAKLAAKFGRPIVTFIDTPGAYPGIEAEQRGQGEAIAQCLALFSQLPVPVIALVAGEGGSGGALALGVADSVLMLENSVYAVLSPEGFAAILWKDRSRSDEACEVMKITAEDLRGLGVVDRVIPEGPGGAHENRAAVIELAGQAIAEELARLNSIDANTLLEGRYARFRAFGSYVNGDK